jgi:UDP-2,3-diacylglucosamine pyrophosphatase LpxH
MAIANSISKVSKRCLERKSQGSVEVPMEEIYELLAQGIDIVIHGHCHRSYKLEPEVGGSKRQVYCIGDWSKGVRFLFYNARDRIFEFHQSPLP